MFNGFELEMFRNDVVFVCIIFWFVIIDEDLYWCVFGFDLMGFNVFVSKFDY